jgi:hypothetical protein
LHNHKSLDFLISVWGNIDAGNANGQVILNLNGILLIRCFVKALKAMLKTKEPLQMEGLWPVRPERR